MTNDLELSSDLAPAPMFTSVMPSASDLEQYWQLASRLCRTEFVPSNLRGKPEAVFAVFLTGRELGIGPMQSLRDVYPVNGRPGMMATLMVQRVRERGHRFTTIRSTPTEATVQIHRRGDPEPQPPVTFTWDDAKRAKLVHKDTYQQYPTALLWSRAASAACRRDASEALGAAVYTPEELDDAPASTTVQVGPPEVDGEPWENGVPKAWAIDNIRDADDAKWLLKQPEISDDYREAVKAAAVDLCEVSWSSFWRDADVGQWREVLVAASEQSGAGSSEALGDGAPSSPAPALTSEMSGAGERRQGARLIPRDARHDPAPDAKSPSAPKQEEPPGVARSEAEGANHDSKPGAGASLPDATLPPDGSQSPGRPSGGMSYSRDSFQPGTASGAGTSPVTGANARGEEGAGRSGVPSAKPASLNREPGSREASDQDPRLARAERPRDRATGTNRPAGGEATTPKAVRGRQPKSAPATGRTLSDPDEAEQADLAAFEQAQADERNPGRWTR